MLSTAQKNEAGVFWVPWRTNPRERVTKRKKKKSPVFIPSLSPCLPFPSPQKFPPKPAIQLPPVQLGKGGSALTPEFSPRQSPPVSSDLPPRMTLRETFRWFSPFGYWNCLIDMFTPAHNSRQGGGCPEYTPRLLKHETSHGPLSLSLPHDGRSLPCGAIFSGFQREGNESVEMKIGVAKQTHKANIIPYTRKGKRKQKIQWLPPLLPELSAI